MAEKPQQTTEAKILRLQSQVRDRTVALTW